MKVWNVSDKEINQLYNNRNVIIPANSIVELGNDVIAFLLNKKEIRGQGLVQLKDGDSKEERYAQGRKQVYTWAQEKYADYEKHTEEREGSRLPGLKPHQAIKDYKKIIEEYDKWVVDGSPIKEEFKETVGEKKIFACPYCEEEFSVKTAYFEHLKSHQKDKDVDASSVGNESKGEGG